MIDIADLEKSYQRGTDRVTACRVGELHIDAGEQVALVGPSGCGKTTLLHLISGLLRPDKGRVTVKDCELTRLGERKRDRFRARHLGYVHQTFSLLAPFTALENVLLGVLFAKGGGKGQDEARLLLDRVGLGDRLHHKPSELSAGQQQRVAVARALVNRPILLLGDEPLGNQDAETGRQVLELMLSLAREMGTTVLIVTHDPNTAGQMRRTVSLPELAG
ncbi:MAG: ABC transporter ATP-binding protein [Planctomycetota bacterium]